MRLSFSGFFNSHSRGRGGIAFGLNIGRGGYDRYDGYDGGGYRGWGWAPRRGGAHTYYAGEGRYAYGNGGFGGRGRGGIAIGIDIDTRGRGRHPYYYEDDGFRMPPRRHLCGEFDYRSDDRRPCPAGAELPARPRRERAERVERPETGREERSEPRPVDRAGAMPKLVHTGDELMKRINKGEGTINYQHEGQRYVLLHDKDNKVTGIMAYTDGKDKRNDDVSRIMTRADLIAMGMKPEDLKTGNANQIGALFQRCLEAQSADQVAAPKPGDALPMTAMQGGFEAPVQPQKLPKP